MHDHGNGSAGSVVAWHDSNVVGFTAYTFPPYMVA